MTHGIRNDSASTPFFDHSCHILSIGDQAAPLDVLTFEGEERLIRPFTYEIEFASIMLNIASESMLTISPPPQHAHLFSSRCATQSYNSWLPADGRDLLRENDLYSNIDQEGRYRTSFLSNFD